MAKRTDYNTPTEEQLNEVEFLASRMGHNPQAIRTKAAAMSFNQVMDLIANSRRYCQQQGISLHVETGSHPATERQVDYVAKLLARRTVESGFSGLVSSLHINGRPDMDAIRKLTKAQASQVIDSLTENY